MTGNFPPKPKASFNSLFEQAKMIAKDEIKKSQSAV